MKTIPELYSIKEIPDGTFPLSLNLKYRYHLEDNLLMEKLNCTEYQTGYFRGGQNTIELVTYKDKIFIPRQLQKYVVKCYHIYLLCPGLDLI